MSAKAQWLTLRLRMRYAPSSVEVCSRVSGTPYFFRVDIDGKEVWRRDMLLIDDDVEPTIGDVEKMVRDVANATGEPALGELTQAERRDFALLQAPIAAAIPMVDCCGAGAARTRPGSTQSDCGGSDCSGMSRAPRPVPREGPPRRVCVSGAPRGTGTTRSAASSATISPGPAPASPPRRLARLRSCVLIVFARVF